MYSRTHDRNVLYDRGNFAHVLMHTQLTELNGSLEMSISDTLDFLLVFSVSSMQALPN